MITCREVVELLCDFIGEELSPEQRQLVEEHLCRCPPCVCYVETYRLTIHITRQLPAASMPEIVLERLQARLKSLDDPPAAP
jgi:anti-sigma factor RsiW